MRRLAWQQPDIRVHVLVDEDGIVVRTITTTPPSVGDPRVGYHVMSEGHVESTHTSLDDAMKAAEAAAL
jgi:hypothetical protein